MFYGLSLIHSQNWKKFSTLFLRYLPKRCKSTKNCLTNDIARDRNKKIKKEEEKRKMRKSQTTAFPLLLFLEMKTYILLGNIFEET